MPRAPSCAYALQRVLNVRHCSQLPKTLSANRGHSLGELGCLLRERRLIETERGREHKRGLVLLQERVDDVEEAPEVAILVLVSDRDECGRDVRRHADGVLDVEALWSHNNWQLFP